MKTQDWLILGAGAIGIYFLTKNTAAAAYSDTQSPQLKTAAASVLQIPMGITPQSTVPEAVQKINAYAQGGETIPRTSSTLLKNVTATVNGETLTGNIARLTTDFSGNTKDLFVAVKQPTRNTSGLTAFDQVIATAKAAGLKKPLNANY
jgi:hypothetical protein